MKKHLMAVFSGRVLMPAAVVCSLLVTSCATKNVNSKGSDSQATVRNTLSTADSGFSFDVYGDSRSMMYLPYKEDQEAEARKLMVDMFDLVLPEKVSEAVIQKHVKLIYNPSTHELVQVVMPFETRSEV